MSPLSSLTLAFLALLLTPSWSHGQPLLEDDQIVRPILKRGVSEDGGPKNTIAFSGEDYFNTNDTSCIIIDGSSVVLEMCHEQVEQPVPITFRKTWDSEIELEELDSPVEYVVIKGGGHYCNSTAECLSQIQSLRKGVRDKRCDLRENFYVGGDGKVYEGRGWGLASYWHLNGLSKKSITVQYLGSHEMIPPSPKAIEAFETTMEIGLWLEKLSKTYRVTSIKQLKMDGNESTDIFSQVSMTSNRWLASDKLSSLWEYTVPGRLNFVFRRHWNASNPTKAFAVISKPVLYVAVSEGGDRCSSRSECISKMGLIQAESIRDYGDLLDNFYIGEGGEVYESRGWHSVPHWYVRGLNKTYFSVRLLGSYANELPPQKAINSLKLLVQTGVWLGKISPNYRIFTLRQIYNQSVLLGNPLFDVVRKWSKWSQNDFMKFHPKSFGLGPFVSKSEWNARTPTISIPSNIRPIRYVMIGDGGSRCFSIDQCLSRLASEESRDVEVSGDVLENFYVGDDGIVYEGRGWDSLPSLHTPFFKSSLITIKFLGSFQDSLPSQPGWLAFLALLDAGIAAGKISQDYKIYSFRHIYNDSSLLGDEITRLFEGMSAWDRELSMASMDQRESSGILPIYQLDDSIGRTMPTTLLSLNLPLDYVVVSDSGEPCFTHESCRAQLIKRQRAEDQLFGGLTYNFYVGEDGSVFAGRAWNSTCHWHVRGVKADTLFVTFLGRFKNSLPSQYAMLAFHCLLNFGVETGKLANDYKIISVRQVYPNTSHAGDMLADRLREWSRWSDYEAHSPGGVSIPFGPSAFVPKSQWSAGRNPSNFSRNLSFPVNHLIILEADESCLNLEDCVLRVQAEERRTHLEIGDALENFYIGEDGRIYEGRGWSQESQWCSRILYYDFITVAFLGKFRAQPPSSKAFTAFEYFIKQGIMEEKLPANYSVVSLRQFLPNGQIPGEALDKYIRTLNNWSNDTSMAFVTDNLEIFPPAIWGRSKSIRQSNKIVHPLKYVYIREGGLPCSSKSECITRMKTAENDVDGITENFYIGGTGDVFQGIGWQYDTKWGYNGWKYSISVYFLGSFESSLPSKKAIGAFNALCQYGVRKGYIDSNYKILYIPDQYNSKKWVGAKFKDLIETWNRWTKTI